MSDVPSETREALIRALAGLPSIYEYDAVLRAGKLPVDERSRKILEDGFSRIKSGHSLWDRKRPPWADTFARLEKSLNDLVQELGTDHGYTVLEIIEEGAILDPLTETARRRKELVEFHDKAGAYRQIYSTRKLRRTASENWLFEKFYELYGEIKAARPGNAGPLYRFTVAGIKLLGVRLNISENTFRVRLKRHLERHTNSDLTDPALRMRIQRALNAHYDTNCS
jgi:hypothetical protein